MKKTEPDETLEIEIDSDLYARLKVIADAKGIATVDELASQVVHEAIKGLPKE